MLFKSIKIENFRNFKKTTVNICDKNIIFGMNDVGKTNFLYALRFVFDNEIRRNGFSINDFNDLNSTQPIHIQVELDLPDADTEDRQRIIAHAGGSRYSDKGNSFYIDLTSEYNADTKIYECVLKWGNDLEYLEKIQRNGASAFEIDKIFNVVYINSDLSLDRVFKRDFISLLDKKEDDLEEIKNKMNELKDEINNLKSVKIVEELIDKEYTDLNHSRFRLKLFPNDITLDPYKSIIPWLMKGDQKMFYPLSGDGQKKLAAYSIIRLNAKRNNKINLFLIEEPENHLHRSALIQLSKIMFGDKDFPYLFLTTHSEKTLTDMDSVNLIRVFNGDNLYAKNVFYTVPTEYKKNKSVLNKSLATALFCDKVFLVEGPSELILFDKVLSLLEKDYLAENQEILCVNGIAFDKYIEIFTELDIKVIVKTDNDIRVKEDAVENIGMERIKKILTKLKVKDIPEIKTISDYNVDTDENKIQYKKSLFSENAELLKVAGQNGIFLSKVDLENDLNVSAGAEIRKTTKLEVDLVPYLQKKKMYNMAEIVEKFDKNIANKVYGSEEFACLRSFI